MSVTPAEVEALEALYAKTDQGAMWFAADFLDSWTPQASAYIAAALNAMPRLLAALRAQDAGVERAAFEAWYDRNRDDGPNMVLSHSMAEKAWFARAALKEADAPQGGGAIEDRAVACADCAAGHPRYFVPWNGDTIHALPGGMVNFCAAPSRPGGAA